MEDCCGNDRKDKTSLKTEETFFQKYKTYFPAVFSFLLLVTGIIFEQTEQFFFKYPTNLIWFGVAYLFVGLPVNLRAIKEIGSGNIFSEFFLMSIATIGAFFIGEYSEGVAVMLFYTIGELFQDAAVDRATRSIKALLDIRPDAVTVIRDGRELVTKPSEVAIGEIIQIKSGEKVALDGELFSNSASFNTAALTGESKPDTLPEGASVLAGMINLHSVAEVKVTALFKDSKLSRILEMVQDATSRKSKTQLFISRFAKIYTPIVVFLAIAIVVVPYFLVEPYIFNTWIYRALVFLVISCPCALVVSIPLGYFGGIGLASRNGILFKGGNYLDVVTKVDTVVMDKTGTLTKGVFKVQKVIAALFDEKQLVRWVSALEKKSTHPIAKAVVQFAGGDDVQIPVQDVNEIAGHGLSGIVEGRKILAGNLKLLKKFDIAYDASLETIVETIVVIAVDNQYAGYITIADEVKEDAALAIDKLHKLGIKTVMLSGDKQAIVDSVAKSLKIDTAYGNLLPEDKVNRVQELKNQGKTIIFVGDGINDAPVIALADAGIAMGGLGSDATIETADVVIQNDQPSKIAMAIEIGKITKTIVYQNIILAFGVKIIVLALGAGGLANLWEAVFADVGVAFLAILNAIRIQKIKFK